MPKSLRELKQRAVCALRSGKLAHALELYSELFGGSALLCGNRAVAAVVVRRKSWLLALAERRFQRIVSGNPAPRDVITHLQTPAGRV